MSTLHYRFSMGPTAQIEFTDTIDVEDKKDRLGARSLFSFTLDTGSGNDRLH